MGADNSHRPLPRAAFLSEETYRLSRLPVSLATTLIPDAYTSPDFYELERERIFATSWVAAGCTSELAEPGDALVVEVGGSSVIVVRGPDGAVRAFHNVCRHRGTPLFEGSEIPESEQRIFDTADAKEFDRRDYGLLPVRAETWGCLVFVNLDDA